ncbi:hypothetical protein K438DRAFT_1781162 [Mycena galopus ATCC 62051]|nr:hypothetical protein K438DRAFT_1781162 [Mycena galopus ATCC 62051]
MELDSFVSRGIRMSCCKVAESLIKLALKIVLDVAGQDYSKNQSYEAGSGCDGVERVDDNTRTIHIQRARDSRTTKTGKMRFSVFKFNEVYQVKYTSLLTDAIESVVARASLDLSLASSFFFPVFFATPQIPVQDAALLDEIFTHLDPTNNPDLLEGFHPDAFEFTSTEPNFRHLSKVAETCKAFHGHSINFMWRSAALGNLLACLPTDLCVLDDLATGSIACVKLLRDAQRSRRAFREEDWARVSIYAARVRHLFSGGGQWSLAKILAPMSLCLLANIFPVLKTLTWNHSNAQFCYIDAFLSPAIKTISFPCTSASLSFLSALPF